MNLFGKKRQFDISIGDTVELTSGTRVKVEEKLGEGGQGVVYKVDKNGKKYALKWYHSKAIKNPEKFYDNLEKNVRKGAPSDKFLWPLGLSQRHGDRFGYIMDLRPADYCSFSQILCAKVRFGSLDAVVECALNITNAFRDLHRKGYSYQDLNDGNFFINPRTGDILVCDNDNVAPYSVNLGIAGKPRYMAPEVARLKSLPDGFSDRFSLAVILFELLFLGHPLEGRKTLVPCMTEELELDFYAKNPLFVYDVDDDSNRPDKHVHVNVCRFWELYPKFIQEKFIKSFCRQSLNGDDIESARQSRLMDSDWQTAFINLRSCLVTCACNDKTILNIDSDSQCFNCKTTIPKPMKITIGKYFLPLFPGVRLYECHTNSLSDDYKKIKGEVTRHPVKPTLWGLKNLDDKVWRILTTDGTEVQLLPDKNIQIGKIVRIYFDSNTIGELKN